MKAGPFASLVLLGTGLLSASAFAADAEEEEATPPPPTQLVTEDVMVTATGEARLLSDSPMTVRVLGEDVLRSSAAGDAAELLRRAPGVPAITEGIDNRGGASGVSLQGASPNRTLVLLDGRPVGGDVGGIVDLASFPAAMLDRIEIVEGPMSALYGSDAMGGVVNLVTRRAQPGVTLAGRVQGGTDRSVTADLFSSWASSRGSFWSATATFSTTAPIDLVAGDAATDRDGRTMLGGRFAGGGRTADDIVELSLQLSDDVRRGTILRKNAAIGYEGLLDSEKRYDRAVVALVWDRRLGPSADLRVRGEVTGYGASLHEDLRDSPIEVWRRAKDTLAGGQIRFGLHHWPGLSALAGLDLSVERLQVVQDRFDAGEGPRHLVDVPGAWEGALEPWIQGDLRLGADVMEIVPGLRLSVHPSYGQAVAPSLALKWKLWRGANLRLSGSRGYRSPSLKERFLVFDHAALGYVVLGEPGLKSESSWGVQGGVEQRFLGRSAVRASFFAQRMSQLIAYVYDATASSSGLSTFSATNIAGARTAGGNLDLDLAHGPVRGSVAYRFLWAVSDDGYFLPDSPIHTLRATFDAEIPWARTRMGTTLSIESERFVDPVRGLTSPTLVLWDARLEQPLPVRGELAVFVAAENLLNQRRDPGVEGDLRPPSPFRLLGGIRGSFRRSEAPPTAP